METTTIDVGTELYQIIGSAIRKATIVKKTAKFFITDTARRYYLQPVKHGSGFVLRSASPPSGIVYAGIKSLADAYERQELTAILGLHLSTLEMLYKELSLEDLRALRAAISPFITHKTKL